MAEYSWKLLVTTAPRPRSADLLNPTLQTLQQAGWSPEEITVYAEPGSVTPAPLAANLVQRPERFGLYANWRDMLAGAVDTADLVATVQDDIVCRPGLRAYLERTIDTAAVYSPYTSVKDFKPGSPGWFQSFSGWQLCGALFLVFPRAVLSALHDRLPLSVPENKHIDAYLGRLCLQQQLPLLLHRPTLVQHLGDACSTSGYAPNSYTRSGHGFVDEPLT